MLKEISDNSQQLKVGEKLAFVGQYNGTPMQISAEVVGLTEDAGVVMRYVYQLGEMEVREACFTHTQGSCVIVPIGDSGYGVYLGMYMYCDNDCACFLKGDQSIIGFNVPSWGTDNDNYARV